MMNSFYQCRLLMYTYKQPATVKAHAAVTIRENQDSDVNVFKSLYIKQPIIAPNVLKITSSHSNNPRFKTICKISIERANSAAPRIILICTLRIFDEAFRQKEHRNPKGINMTILASISFPNPVSPANHSLTDQNNSNSAP